VRGQYGDDGNGVGDHGSAPATAAATTAATTTTTPRETHLSHRQHIERGDSERSYVQD